MWPDFSHERLPSIHFTDQEWNTKDLHRAVRILVSLGAKFVNQHWSLAGSQEITLYRFQLDNEIITMQAETYMGLGIFAQQNILDTISKINTAELP